MLIHNSAFWILYRNPFQLSFQPIVIVIKGLDVFILNSVKRMTGIKGFLEPIFPAILGYQVNKLLHNR